MDLYAKKILDFLQANPNLDLETTDIAFHLKLDEHFVQNRMDALLSQGVITNRKNEYGRLYWYIFCPETEILVMEPPPAPVSSGNSDKIDIEKEPLKTTGDFDEFVEKERKKIPVLGILLFIVMLGAFGVPGYLALKSIDKKIDHLSGSIDIVRKETIIKAEYNQYRNEFSSKVQSMENEIRSLVVTIDSLKTVLVNIEKQQEKEPVKISKPQRRRK